MNKKIIKVMIASIFIAMIFTVGCFAHDVEVLTMRPTTDMTPIISHDISKNYHTNVDIKTNNTSNNLESNKGSLLTNYASIPVEKTSKPIITKNKADVTITQKTSENNSVNPTTIIPNTTENNTQEEVTLSEFGTKFKNATKSRSVNISLASVAVDGKIIMPGETFSFNDTVGPTTRKRGYKLGRIFIKGKDAKGYGGGVCQVSSTIYNAALMADLEIVEQHAHSKPVGYVPKGKDAATSYGGKDFKFLNNKPYPIKINTYIQNEAIYVALQKV